MFDIAMIERTLAALRANNMDAFLVKDPQELLEKIKELVPEGATVSCGGSLTLAQTGVMDLLRSGRYRFLDREGKTPPEVRQIYRDTFSADCFFTSSNAVTEKGDLYNIDGTGNRVAAMIYGPDQVVVVVGANKIIPDMASADRRLREVAAPLNAKRLSRQTGCLAAGHCTHCHAPQRICCDYVKMSYQREPGRVKVFILPESYGY